MAHSEWPPDPKRSWKKRAPAGRKCVGCGTPLSQYNKQRICQLCKASDTVPRRGWKKRAGRKCVQCEAPLSRYNDDVICSLCKARDKTIPEEFLEDLNG